jgi:hydroxymethylbilane synthase
VRDGEYDATVLAAAGLRRLGVAFADDEALPLEMCPPAPGQGALAIQMRADDPAMRRVRAALDHRPTRTAVETEREILRLAGATCLLPLGVYARDEGGEIVVDAALAADGVIRHAHVRGSEQSDVAQKVADALGVLVRA